MTRNPDRGAARPGWDWKRPAKASLAVSAIYIWAYYLTVFLVLPLQQAALPGTVMCLLFFPHGVRVLTAWLFGWRSVPMLLPGALLCNLHFAGEQAFDPDVLFGTMASLVAAPLAFALLGRLVSGLRLGVGHLRAGPLVAVGVVASIFNLMALRLAYGLGPHEGLVILIGDVGGLVMSLGILWLVLRLLPSRA